MSERTPPEVRLRVTSLIPVSLGELVTLINTDRERAGVEPLVVPPHARLEDERGNPIEFARIRWDEKGAS